MTFLRQFKQLLTHTKVSEK